MPSANPPSKQPAARRKPTPQQQQRDKINRLARKHAETALAYIANTIQDETASHAVRLRAAEIVMDRAYGKATNRSEVNVSGEVNVQSMHLHAIQEIAAERLARYAEGDTGKLSYAGTAGRVPGPDGGGEVIEHDGGAASLGLGDGD